MSVHEVAARSTRWYLRRGLVLAALVALTACGAPRVKQVEFAPILAARAQPVGARVVISGIVTVESGTFNLGFACQDASGGIYVVHALDRTLVRGDRAHVGGTIARQDGQIVIVPSRITIGVRAPEPAPVELQTGAAGAGTEGRLIAVRGQLIGAIRNDLPWGWKLQVDDGTGRLQVFISSLTRIDVTRLRPEQWLRVTGFHGRYKDHTELLPRSNDDVVIVDRPASP